MTSAVSGSIVLLSECSVTNIIAKGGYAAFKNHPRDILCDKIIFMK